MRILLVWALGTMLGGSVIATTPAPLEVPAPAPATSADAEGATKVIDPDPHQKPAITTVARERERGPSIDELTEDWEVDVVDWKQLADCESGDWDANGEPEPGSARWSYGLAFDHGDIFEGGLNFHPDTWESFRDPDMPAHAGRADRWQEIEVAERVLDEQGWNAWPVCSEKLDLDE